MSLNPTNVVRTTGLISDFFSKLAKFWQWWKARRYPKPPINQYGIVVGIIAENDAQYTQLKNDFLSTLQDQLTPYEKLTLIELQENLAKRIQDKDIKAILERTESVFLLWGRLRRRNIDGKDTFVMDLRSAVRHNPIAEFVQTTLANEMQELLPPRRLIPAQNDLVGFEINALTVDLSVRYIIANAAYLSNQRELAVELWKSLHGHLATINVKRLGPSVVQLIEALKPKVIINLVTFYLDEASLCQYRWRVTRDVTFLEQMLVHLDAAESYSPNLFQAAILRALHSFVVKQDVKQARALLMPYAAISDPTWSFDMAFFLVWEGKLTRATGFYKKAFRQNPESRVLVEIEEWLLWMLADNPDKVQLHYCVGLINYFGKKDFAKAKDDFLQFMELSEGRFPKERRQVQKYLEVIEHRNTADLLWDD